MSKHELFKSDGMNPVVIITVGGVVLIFVLLVWFMTTMPYRAEKSEQTVERKAAENAGRDDGSTGRKSDAVPLDVAKTGDEVAADGEDAANRPSPEEEREILENWKKSIEAEWQTLQETFASEGISVDLERKRVSVKGAIIRDKESRRYPIEYVVVSEGGNTHEAMILIKATPSNLNAALLSLGLEPGTTVIYRKKDPAPAQEDIDSGKVSAYEVVPPCGTVMRIYVHYEGWEERPYRPLEDLLMDLRTRKPLERIGWVYVGSRFANVLLGKKRIREYMADMERNVVALYLTGYGNAIFDVNTVDGIDDSLFDVNPDNAPPLGAKVSLVFALEEITEEG
jgi:hypothetical protein